MKFLPQLLLALLAIGWTQTGFTQANANIRANKAVQIAQAREANAALMHHYNWNSRTELVVQGQVKDIRIELVNYGPYGQLQRALLNDQPASGAPSGPTPIGFLRRAIADNEKEQMQQFLTGLRGLLEQYTLPTTGKILDFIMTATPSVDANGLIQLSGSNVVQPGDNLNMWVNPWTKHLQHLQVNTTYQGDTVQLTATFATVPGSGLNYASFAEVTVPAKQLSVQVQNYNYARLAY